jgi:glycosyltransferase involved in cell wall biosynthesis
MACATAVVSSDGGALPEVVGDAGVLVPAGDPEALAAAASRLLAEPERAEQLGRAALARIRSEFSWHTVAMKMTERYQAVRADCAHASS